jgi:hypothetical protein
MGIGREIVPPVKIKKLVCFGDEMWRKIEEISSGRWKRRKEEGNNQREGKRGSEN